MKNRIDRENIGRRGFNLCVKFFGLIRIYNCDFETMMILR